MYLWLAVTTQTRNRIHKASMTKNVALGLQNLQKSFYRDYWGLVTFSPLLLKMCSYDNFYLQWIETGGLFLLLVAIGALLMTAFYSHHPHTYLRVDWTKSGQPCWNLKPEVSFLKVCQVRAQDTLAKPAFCSTFWNRWACQSKLKLNTLNWASIYFNFLLLANIYSDL